MSEHYDLARTGSKPPAFLHCDSWVNKSRQTDCSTFTKNGKLNSANRYSISGWSHDLSRKVNSYDDDALFDRFVKVVNSQSEYNTNGSIVAIPIIIYHKAGDEIDNYTTGLELFEREMKYLHDENYNVLKMSDLGYNEKDNYLYIK